MLLIRSWKMKPSRRVLERTSSSSRSSLCQSDFKSFNVNCDHKAGGKVLEEATRAAKAWLIAFQSHESLLVDCKL
eukprot:1054566-Amphidinium_carterae.1